MNTDQYVEICGFFSAQELAKFRHDGWALKSAGPPFDNAGMGFTVLIKDMYTTHEQEAENQPDRKRAEVSQDNARDIVDAIDLLIRKRIDEHGSKYPYNTEAIELLKRKITDYLLVTDPRAGVFKKPE